MRFRLNGEEKEFTGDPDTTLHDYLKIIAGVPVTGVGCNGDGMCGACAVLLDNKAVLSCRTPMAKVAGMNVITPDESEQRIQDTFSIALRKKGAAECHYCVAELIISARIFLQNNPGPTEKELRRALAHDLCRCIGHHKVVRSLENALEMLNEQAPAGNGPAQ
ncbi:MAG: 2Fe-2S iron-sulfur cluster binding domain-containing protein [Spirochaetes bacterium]|nr:2Fe-2S iron-sulfur cluster binding domain-containing protein [Spirochaetota bacterium]